MPATLNCPPVLVITTHVGAATNGGSEAQYMVGPDGDFFVKFPNNPQGLRVLFNEHVVGRVGEVLGCASAGVEVVTVDSFLAGSIHYKSGIAVDAGDAHGSRLIDKVDTIDLARAIAANVANRDRYIGLMVLFTICEVGDQQYVYGANAPNLLYSVDHGWAFGGSPDWTEASITGRPIPTDLMKNGPGFTNAEAAASVPGLNLLTDGVLEEIVECPPGWGVSLAERRALRAYLRQRLDAVMSILGVAP